MKKIYKMIQQNVLHAYYRQQNNILAVLQLQLFYSR